MFHVSFAEFQNFMPIIFPNIFVQTAVILVFTAIIFRILESNQHLNNFNLIGNVWKKSHLFLNLLWIILLLFNYVLENS